MRYEKTEWLRKIAKKCEHPSGRGIWIWMNRCWYLCMILLGRNYYFRLRRKYPGYAILYSPTASIGDLCYIRKVLPYFLKTNHIEKPYLLVVEKSVYDAAEVLGIGLCIPASKIELFPLAAMHTLYGDETEEIFNCFLWEPFYQKYIKEDIPYENLYVQRECGLDTEGQSSETVILAPYEKTATLLEERKLSFVFWRKLADKLKLMGFRVYTNCRKNSGEKAIPGTEKLDVPLRSIQEAVGKASAFVAVRSGLVDFLCDVPIPQYILYPDQKWLEKFSIAESSANKKLAEIVYEPYLKEPDRLAACLAERIGQDTTGMDDRDK